MHLRSAPIVGIWIALLVAACGSEASSAPQSGGSGGSPTGGSFVGNTGGSLVGDTGGSFVGNTGGSLAGDTGGSPVGDTGGSSPVGTGGSSLGGSSGSGTGGGGATGGVETGGDPPGGSPLGGGSASTGGGESGGAETVPAEPELVTSGPDDYWNTEAQVTQPTSGTATLVIDPTTTFQRWDGFGGTFNEMGWDALSVVGSEIPRALELLFGEEYANFVYGRIPMGASDYAMSWYTYAETANDYTMEDFTIARDREMLIPYIQAALEIEPNLRLWGSPWIVPNWMMNGRAMRSDPQTLEAHALYFARFVEEYAKEGLTIEAVHLQNEPGYARVDWDDSVFINFFRTYLGPKFVEREVAAEIWCGTMSHPDDANLATAVAQDPDSMQYVTGFGLQWNHEDTVASLAPFGPVMQTEHRCGNYNFEAQYWDRSRYDANEPQNDHLYGEESWQLIRDWIVGGVNSYLAWNMVLDTQGRSLDGWPQNALLVVDRAARTVTETPAYYVFRHYSHYIAPGATRIETTGTPDAVAFLNPDGSIVTEVYNSANSSVTMIVDVGGTSYQFDVPAHGWATLRVG